MATITETITNISEIIEETFSELIKLVLRKTIRPTLNPIGRNSRTIFNEFTRRSERVFNGTDPSDCVNKYIYSMTTEAIGWTSDSITVFRMIPKAGPCNRINPTVGRAPLSSSLLPSSSSIGPGISFRRMIESIATSSSNLSSVISNRRGGTNIINMTYGESFKQLNSIGQDIINQTDPLVSSAESARMSTAMLRARLFNLETLFTHLSTTYKDMWPSFVDMVRLINSLDSSNTPSIITLVFTLSEIPWANLSPAEQAGFVDKLGQNFINDFNSNELIAILLGTVVPELIISTSLLYSLLKQLYVVFGYSELIPNLLNLNDPSCIPDCPKICRTKNQGAFIVRPGFPIDPCQPMCPRPCQEICPEVCGPSECIDCIPPPQCVYDFIKIFIALYPEISSLMGGCAFPAPCQGIRCCDIPPSYLCLQTLADFLLRYTLFSYCIYFDFISSRQVSNALGINGRIDERVRYLRVF